MLDDDIFELDMAHQMIELFNCAMLATENTSLDVFFMGFALLMEGCSADSLIRQPSNIRLLQYLDYHPPIRMKYSVILIDMSSVINTGNCIQGQRMSQAYYENGDVNYENNLIEHVK